MSFLIEIVVLVVLASLDPHGNSEFGSLIFVALPFFTELIPITTIYYLHRQQMTHSRSVGLSSQLESSFYTNFRDGSLRESSTDALSIDALRSDVEDRLRNNSSKKVFMHLSG